MDIPASFRRPLAIAVTAAILCTGYTAASVIMPAHSASAAELLGASAVVAPTGLKATAGVGQITATWTASAVTTVTGYSIQVSTDPTFADASTSTTLITGRTTATKALTGLNANTLYNVRIASVDANGVGAYSAAVTGTTFATAAAPSAPKAVAGNKSFTFSWTAPTVTGGSAVTGYKVDYSKDSTFSSGVTSINLGKVTSTVISGLSDNTPYFARVSSINGVGTGAASTVASTTTFGVPDAPTSFTATAGNGTAALKWVAPVNKGGTVLSGYTIQYSTTSDFAVIAGTVSALSTATTATISGLPAGSTYYFRIMANNVVGSSVAVGPISSTTFNVPSAPNTPSAVAGVTSATVKWTAPTSNGGSAITGYTVQASKTSDFATIDATVAASSTAVSASVTGLTAGQSYFFRVLAKNVVGSGASSTSVSATIFNVPSAAQTLSAVAGNKSLTVKWTAPASNGGTAVTGYTVQASKTADFAVIDGTVTAAATATSIAVPVSGINTPYYYRVAAKNAAGTGAFTTGPSTITTFNVPASATSVTATKGAGLITVKWVAPASNGGSAITGYDVQVSTDPTFASITKTVTATSTAVSSAVSGLAPATTYYARVIAKNVVGSATPSATASAVTSALPGLPTSVTAVAVAPTATVAPGVKVTWVAPTAATLDGAAITGYKVQYSTDATFASGVTTVALTGTGVTTTLANLSASTKYYVQVAAVTGAGTGAYSPVVSAVTGSWAAPDAPAAPVATLNGTTASLAWVAPANNGVAITGYTVTATPSNGLTITQSGTTPSATITGLTAGTNYTFHVTATNAAGTSAASPESNTVRPVSVASAPTAVAASVTGLSTATVTWNAPADDGGSPITGYRVTASPSTGVSIVQNGTDTSAQVSGLTAGTSYIFSVVAINAAGSSPAAASASTLIATAPAAPAAPSATVTSGSSVNLAWAAAAANGSPISSYRVQYSTDSTFASGVTTVDSGKSTTGLTVSGLTAGSTYFFRTAAVNAYGMSDYSAATAGIVVDVAPNAVSAVTATVADAASANVSWTAPTANSGTSATSYVVTATATGGDTVTSTVTDTSAVLTGLTTGASYKFAVVAMNASGQASASTASAAVLIATAPAAPDAPSLTNVDGPTVAVAWNAPAANGSPITGYTIQYSSDPSFATGVKTAATTSPSYTMSGLTHGVTYYVQVKATNALGTSGFSASGQATVTMTATVFAGAAAGVDGTGTGATLVSPGSAGFDAAGNMYFVDMSNLRKATPAGVVTTIMQGVSGTVITVAPDGTIYMGGSGSITKIAPNGQSTLIAGNGTSNMADGQGTAAGIGGVSSMYLASDGTLYFGDSNRVRSMSPTGYVSTLAGNSSTTSVNGQGAAASFGWINGIVKASDGALYMADGNGFIRKMTADGNVSTFAGNTTDAYGVSTADGQGTAAGLFLVNGLTIDSSNNLYTYSGRIRKITLDGTVSTFAGSSTVGHLDAQGASAAFYGVNGLSTDASGNVYVTESLNKDIRKITPSGAVSTFVGAGIANNGNAQSATFGAVAYNAFDAAGNMYVSDPTSNQIRKITPAGVVSLFAGSPYGISGRVDGNGTNAVFSDPRGIVFDSSGNMFVADGSYIRKITPSGDVSTFAGGGTYFGSIDGTGTGAAFYGVNGLAIDSANNLYAAEGGIFGNKVRKITPAGVVTTLAGSNTSGSADGQGANASFNFINGIAVDAAGNIYVTDTSNSKIRKITQDGTVTTLAGSGTSGNVDGVGAAASFQYLNGIMVKADGKLLVADAASVRQIDPATGAVVTLVTAAGSGAGQLYGIGANAAGTIFVTDSVNGQIRQLI